MRIGTRSIATDNSDATIGEGRPLSYYGSRDARAGIISFVR
jgi:hypothetical protein